SLEIDDARGAGDGAPELSALPPAHARPARADSQRLSALERAAQGASARAAESVRALAAAAARPTRPHPAAARPVGVDDPGGAGAGAPQPGALAPDEPRGARADPRALAADATGGARAAAPGAPAAAPRSPVNATMKPLVCAALGLGLLGGCTSAKAGDSHVAAP